MVTPFAGVWIEIRLILRSIKDLIVTPFAGVWIEICLTYFTLNFSASLPSRECGLKCRDLHQNGRFSGHSLRGSVD